MHRLLIRQLQRQLGKEFMPAGDLQPVLRAISSHYEELDQERALLENALEVNSQELTEANARLRAQAAREHALLRGLLDSIPDLISVKSPECIYLSCNKAFEAYLGVPEAAIIGKTDFDFQDAETATFLQNMDKEMLALNQPSFSEEWVTYPDGNKVCLGLLRTPYASVEGELLGLIVIGRDITERKRAEQQLAYLAQFDPLTELPNRQMLYDRLSQTLTHTQRAGARIACMFVDLDRFKYINDTYGHAFGDKLLTVVAERLRQCVRSGDTVGRLGGDEFAVVLAQLARPEDAHLVAQKIVTALEAPFDLDGHETYISASIGIAIYPGDGEDADELLRNADTAMYRAKEQGRNNHQFYMPEMNERLSQRQQLETRLRGAVERQEYLLHYQPKVELVGGTICGFEALLRWQHPERGLVSPLEFVPVLEDTGQIVAVGEWVLKSVCAQIKSWQAQGITALPVAINMSARQFQRKTLDAFIELIATSGVDPALIKLELTESLLMRDAEEAVQSLARLKASGVRLSIDDFGTGYSSLAYLKRFPIDEIKIDRAFISDVTSNSEDAQITVTIINLAHSLNLRAVAEGVETESQLNFLRAQGCDEMQGYYFAMPLGLEDCTRLLREAKRLHLAALHDAAEERPTVVVLDDNLMDLELLKRTLAPEGYRILIADSPEGAFEAMARHPVSIVISDHELPGTTGVKFLAQVRRLYPDAIRIVISGIGDADTVTDAVNEAGIHKYLSKDWDALRLRAEVREAYLRHRQTAG